MWEGAKRQAVQEGRDVAEALIDVIRRNRAKHKQSLEVA